MRWQLLDVMKASDIRSSAIVLVLANLVPLVGVYQLGWSAPEVMLIYWAESAIICFYTVLKIALSKGKSSPKEKELKLSIAGAEFTTEIPLMNIAWLPKPLFILAFIFLYSVFMSFYLMFIISFLFEPYYKSYYIGELHEMLNITYGPVTRGPGVAGVAEATSTGLVALIALLLSHGFSFWTNYIQRKEYHTASPASLIVAPYLRILPMHFAIVIGFLLQAPVAVLVAVKIIVDLYSHLQERNAFTKAQKAEGTNV